MLVTSHHIQHKPFLNIREQLWQVLMLVQRTTMCNVNSATSSRNLFLTFKNQPITITANVSFTQKVETRTEYTSKAKTWRGSILISQRESNVFTTIWSKTGIFVVVAEENLSVLYKYVCQDISFLGKWTVHTVLQLNPEEVVKALAYPDKKPGEYSRQ